MRQQNLSAVKAGITRLRDKGGASPDSLYDLVNGYVTAARTIRIRPGTRIAVELPAGTKGLAWHKGKFVVFSHQVMASTDQVSVEVVRHPEDPEQAIADIHFAMPFLGYLYVVAEFANGDVYHYWLEQGEEWEANKVYLPGTLVRPSTPNGVMYRVESDRAGLTPWTPNTALTEGGELVPTEDNGYKYKVAETIGDNPRTGSTEPTWPTETGATVIVDADNPNPFINLQQVPIGAAPPDDVVKRYARWLT